MYSLLFVAVLGAASFFWTRMNRREGAFVRASVRVEQGTVDLYRLKLDGERVFLRPISQGDGAEVDTSTRVYGNGGSFRFVGPLCWKVTVAVVSAIEWTSRDVRKPQFARLYTEAQFERFIASGLRTIPSLSKIRLEFHPDGFVLRAHAAMRPFDVDVRAKGILSIDADGQLFVRLEKAYAAGVPMPPFVLRQLEDVYYRNVHAERYRLRLLNLEYREGAVLVTCRRPALSA